MHRLLVFVLVAVLGSCRSLSIGSRSEPAADPEDSKAPGFGSLLGKLLKNGKTTPEERHMSKNRLILNEIAAHHPDTSSLPKLAFHNEETVAVISYKEQTVAACKLMEVDLQSHLVTVLENLTNYMPVYPVETKRMVSLISQCQHVGEPIQSSSSRSSAARAIKEEDNSSWTLLNAIVPGTKWCGPGDKAQSYEELGSQADVDKCCRAHDYCPIKVGGMAKAHGLVNLSFYTKTHCACDDEFFSCLKNLDSPLARMIGNVFFNVIQVPCIDEQVSATADQPSAKFQYVKPDSRSAREVGTDQKPPAPGKIYKLVQVNRQF